VGFAALKRQNTEAKSGVENPKFEEYIKNLLKIETASLQRPGKNCVSGYQSGEKPGFELNTAYFTLAHTRCTHTLHTHVAHTRTIRRTTTRTICTGHDTFLRRASRSREAHQDNDETLRLNPMQDCFSKIS